MDYEKMKKYGDMCESWMHSWFSWGSPIGLTLGFVLFSLGVGILLTSIGFFLFLLHAAELIG